ncbi:leucine-rich melanocyte differentiation-associated protein-like isoform X2 [Orussus abietinus]|uniref:leucine-rich melanocyte differentiation-associated protein-like isoform X2 n=1 Tax=Orussus abietinus TaxID=222816 RepID=UPI000626DBF7|nr:leucine-rich melanocyte differentiation-associated protein-like isoform X2 [Orussus abietinus]
MAEFDDQDFNRSALNVRYNRAWYTGQRVERIPSGLIRVVGSDCLSLDLSFNELTSISAVRDFTCLEELILDNNDLRDLRSLPPMPTIRTLSLNNNKITDIDATLERIRECCPDVSYVSLLGNPGCPDQLTDPTVNDDADYERYRLYAIHVLPPSLRFLDSRPVTKQERLDARSRGRFLRTVKLAFQSSPSLLTISPVEEIEASMNVNYTPLPRGVREVQVPVLRQELGRQSVHL